FPARRSSDLMESGRSFDENGFFTCALRVGRQSRDPCPRVPDLQLPFRVRQGCVPPDPRTTWPSGYARAGVDSRVGKAKTVPDSIRAPFSSDRSAAFAPT